MVSNSNEFKGNIEDIEKGSIGTISEFKGNLTQKILTRWHYLSGNLICIAIVFTFLGLLIFGRNIPDYLITLVGGILGYYIARAPYDLRR